MQHVPLRVRLVGKLQGESLSASDKEPFEIFEFVRKSTGITIMMMMVIIMTMTMTLLVIAITRTMIILYPIPYTSILFYSEVFGFSAVRREKSLFHL